MKWAILDEADSPYAFRSAFAADIAVPAWLSSWSLVAE